MKCETIKIQSSHKKTQGDYVEINVEDFDSKIHKKYKEPKDVSRKTKEDS